jgi:hypothetical protein
MLLFWKAGPRLRLAAAEVARELIWGEEVEGLIDLPIQEIIAQIKANFPEHAEQPGLLSGRGATGKFEATWSWQHVRVEDDDLTPLDRQRLIEAIEEFGCLAYEQDPLP